MDYQNRQALGYEIGIRDLLLFIWRIRWGILVGALAGLASGYLLKSMSSPDLYKSTFVIEVDEDSLPAMTAGKEVAQALKSIINAPAPLKEVISEVSLMSNLSEAENKSSQIAIDKTSAYVDAYYASANKEGKSLVFRERTFDIVPSEDSLSYVVIATLPMNGVQSALGETFVKNLNSVINTKNASILATHRKTVQSNIADLGMLMNDSNTTNSSQRRDVENKLIDIRSMIAGIEYELSLLAMPNRKIQEYFAFSSESEAKLSAIKVDVDSSRPKLSSRLNSEAFEESLERIVKLLSVLEKEQKIGKPVSESVRNKLAGLMSEYSNNLAMVRGQEETERSLVKSLNDIQATLALDKRKFILPTFKLNKSYYESAKKTSLEVPIYPKSRDHYVAMGALIGGLICGFVMAFTLLGKKLFSSTQINSISESFFEVARAK